MKTPKCPIVFSAESFDELREVLRRHLDGVLIESEQRELILNLIYDVKNTAERTATAIAAAQWQAYVEGLTEARSNYRGRIWCIRGFWNDEEDTHVTRILPPEEI